MGEKSMKPGRTSPLIWKPSSREGRHRIIIDEDWMGWSGCQPVTSTTHMFIGHASMASDLDS